MTRYITLTLTHTEASAMLTALGNGMGEEDDMMALFTGDWRRVQACQRAEQKLRQAFHGKSTSTLTPQEARAVSRAAHNILDNEEIARDFFDSSQDLAAARRGTNKLNAIAYGDSE